MLLRSSFIVLSVYGALKILSGKGRESEVREKKIVTTYHTCWRNWKGGHTHSLSNLLTFSTKKCRKVSINQQFLWSLEGWVLCEKGKIRGDKKSSVLSINPHSMGSKRIEKISSSVFVDGDCLLDQSFALPTEKKNRFGSLRRYMTVTCFKIFSVGSQADYQTQRRKFEKSVCSFSPVVSNKICDRPFDNWGSMHFSVSSLGFFLLQPLQLNRIFHILVFTFYQQNHFLDFLLTLRVGANSRTN